MGALISNSRRCAADFRRNRSLTRTALLAVTAVALLVAGPQPAHAKLWTGAEHKCELTIPDMPAPWEFLPIDNSWKKYDIVVGADRRLKELRDGTPASGQGGLLHLAVSAAPEGATLDGLAADAQVREFLTARFTDGMSGVEVEEEVLNADIPCRILRVTGKAANFSGTQANCNGHMLIALAHKRVYKLRMYGWATEQDAEGIRDDLTMIEVDGLTIVDPATALAGNEEAGPERPDPAEDDEPEPEGEEERLEFEEHNLVMVKHKKLTRAELDRDEARGDILAKFSANEATGAYDVFIYAFPAVGGKQRTNLQEQIGTAAYQEFLERHSAGDVWVHPWPKKPTTVPSGSTFLVLPDLSAESREVISDEDRKKPDPEASYGELERKLGVAEKPKIKNVGRDFKTPGPTYRFVIGGNLEGRGDHVVLKYGWVTNNHDFVIYISFLQEAYLKYGEAVRATIESIRHPKKWEKRWD